MRSGQALLDPKVWSHIAHRTVEDRHSTKRLLVLRGGTRLGSWTALHMALAQ